MLDVLLRSHDMLGCELLDSRCERSAMATDCKHALCLMLSPALLANALDMRGDSRELSREILSVTERES